jgi:5-methyltetrahydropteroyltriglutamate--homocysteine methyltransferase
MKNNLEKSGRKLLTYAYGFPRLGKDREYKKLIEGFWSKKLKEEELKKGIFELEEERLKIYQKYVDKFPIGEMTFYDNVLDTAIMLGLYKVKDLEQYFSFCRGKEALELTKWFNTNYHYLVPRFPAAFKIQDFKLAWNKTKEELLLHKKGIHYLIGPFTFLKLSKGISGKNFEKYLLFLAEIYADIARVKDFAEIQIEEPSFATDISEDEVKLIKAVYKKITAANSNVNLFTYYDSVDFLKELYELPLKAIGLDFVNGKENFSNIKKQGFPNHITLIAGLVQGRNIWKTDIIKALTFLQDLSKYAKNLALSNASPLYHLPLTIEGEQLDKRLLEKIAFAKERLAELNLLARIYEGREPLMKKEITKDFGLNKKVKERIGNLKDDDFKKALPYKARIKIQRKLLSLPLFPTTTIGSYPQTEEVRKKRQEFNLGKISKKDYQDFIKEKIRGLIKFQEDLGLDVLVHGEFERTDMVEFFAQRLAGFATTKQGWIISYGTRVYRPPIIYGDVWRPEPLTLNEIVFAQSLTRKPLKGMLTGPITIIAWSFIREDIAVSEVAYQIALCIQDEIRDYEKEGIKIVQIDEPAFREKAPLKKRNWQVYFDWAIKSLNLAFRAKPQTQIQTHMCYSEFGEITKYILALDFDVLLIEAARSKADILSSFGKSNFRKQIGLGVWDIHSPAVPQIKDMAKIIDVALKFFPKENLWINPDCGLKTRGWEETKSSLINLVELAKNKRSEFK